MRKKGIPEALSKSVMSLHEGENTSVRVDSGLSEWLEVKDGTLKVLCCHLLWWMVSQNR